MKEYLVLCLLDGTRKIVEENSLRVCNLSKTDLPRTLMPMLESELDSFVSLDGTTEEDFVCYHVGGCVFYPCKIIESREI